MTSPATAAAAELGATASNGTFGRAYEHDAVELGHRVAVVMLWRYEILPELRGQLPAQ